MLCGTSAPCLLVLVIVCDLVISDPLMNLTENGSNEKRSRKVHHRHRHRKPGMMPIEAPLEGEPVDSRIPKLFSFHALDEDLRIEHRFAVPFLKVPVKKSVERTGEAVKSLVNLNTPALILSGMFVAGSALFGLLFNSFVGKTTNGIGRKSRISDINGIFDPLKLVQRNSDGEKTETALGEIFQILEEKFNKNGVDITTCIQKIICIYVRKSAERFHNGRATGTNKIIDGLASSDWILQYLEGSAIRDAIDSGIANINCGYRYPSCQWSNPEKHIMNLVRGFVQNIPGVQNN